MWMMGYNEVPLEDHDPINMVESNYSTNTGRNRFRPLVPRPPPPTCAAASSSANRFHSTHHDHLIPFNHNLGDQQNKREFNSQQMVVVSSRWNPTPEQLQTLEELYRRGTRTPSADEIQHITAQLRRYGKIEGKNVFYWFQNHKARERQKRRRQLDNLTTDVHQPPSFFATDINNTIQCKDNSEVEETRNWAIPTFSEKSVLSERAGKSESRMTTIAVAAADKRWIPADHQQEEEDDDEEEGGGNDQVLLVHRRRKNFPAKNSTWHDMMQSLSSSTSATTNHIPLMINSTCTPPATLIATSSASKTASSNVVSSHNNQQHQFQHEIDYCYQTLELFPVNSNGGGNAGVEQPTSEKCFVPTSDVSHSTPRQFIEFLPLKN